LPENVLDRLAGRPLGWVLHDSAAAYGSATFLIQDQSRLSFAEFDREVDAVSATFLKLGIERGDHVGLWLPNSAEWARVFFACARIGAVVIPINTRYKAEEAAYLIAQGECKALVIASPAWNVDYYDMLCSLAPDLPLQSAGDLRLERFPNLRCVFYAAEHAPAGTWALKSIKLEDGDFERLKAAERTVEASDLLLICYTSGTTGTPKGAMHNHGVVKQATRVGLALHMDERDVVLGHMPFYHVAGLFMALLPAMSLGAAVVIMREWKTSLARDLIELEGVTVMGGIPTHFHDMVAAKTRNKLSSIKSAWIGGSTVPTETYKEIMSALGIPKLLSTYGMTENTISTTFNRWDDPLEIVCANKAPVLANCEVGIFDPTTGEPLPVGVDGEIRCRGETVMLGYYKNTKATREAVTEDGWLRTGDIGHFDVDGYLSVTGRIKEMFKVGGTNAYPAEIEQQLARHPAVAMSAVVGVPDDRLGEVGFAFVVLRQGVNTSQTEIIAHCRSGLADYKTPRYVRFVEDLPRTPSGKIKKFELAREAQRQVLGKAAGMKTRQE
jgi:fatty-acyl-CoA synthase